MKKIFRALGIAFKEFFKSIGTDIKDLFKKHYLKAIGLIICFIVPVVVLLTTYVQKVENATKWVVPFVIIIPLAILIILYWSKAKSYLNAKVHEMRVENNIEKGKHAGALIIADTIKAFMTCLPFALAYIFINEIQKYYAEVSKIFLFITICEAVGGFFCILDTAKNTLKLEESEK